jgi:steroid delta-isomerase-like uncharacterized protein
MADHKALAQGMFDEIRAGSDIDATIDKYLAEDFVEHEAIPGMDNTRDTPRQLFKMMHAAFPDFHVDVHDMLLDGDKVVARVTMGGTHQGEFMGVPASGNQIEIGVIDIMQFRDDKLVAHWGVMDMAGAMEQMGAGPPG